MVYLMYVYVYVTCMCWRNFEFQNVSRADLKFVFIFYLSKLSGHFEVSKIFQK